MKVQTRDLGGNRLLRVASVTEPNDGREIVVVDIAFRSEGLRSLLKPGDERLTLDRSDVADLRDLLEELEG